MALGAIPTCDSLLAEGANMSALGASHADKTHWSSLDLPFADFLLNARLVLNRRVPSRSATFTNPTDR